MQASWPPHWPDAIYNAITSNNAVHCAHAGFACRSGCAASDATQLACLWASSPLPGHGRCLKRMGGAPRQVTLLADAIAHAAGAENCLQEVYCACTTAAQLTLRSLQLCVIANDSVLQCVCSCKLSLKTHHPSLCLSVACRSGA